MPSPHTVTGSQQCHQETPMAVPQDGLAFSTFVVGSLPRPRWVRDLIEDRKAGRISAKDADELLDDAVPLAIRLQERAGLDYVSDGEWRRESYVKVFADAVKGFKADLFGGGSSQFSSLAYPAVVSGLEPTRPIAAKRSTSCETPGQARSPALPTAGCLRTTDRW